MTTHGWDHVRDFLVGWRPLPRLDGCRFVLVRDAERYPFGFLPAGTRGTVVRDESDDEDQTLAFLPDDPVVRRGFAEWGGEVHWYGPNVDGSGEGPSARVGFLTDARPLLRGEIATGGIGR